MFSRLRIGFFEPTLTDDANVFPLFRPLPSAQRQCRMEETVTMIDTFDIYEL